MLISELDAPPWPEHYDPQTLFEDAAAFALQSLNRNQALEILTNAPDTDGSADLRYVSRIWHCAPEGDQLHPDAAPNGYEFVRKVRGASWRICPSNRYLLFVTLHLAGHSFGIGLEVAVADREDRPVQAISMFPFQSFDKIDLFVHHYSTVKYLRLVEIKGTGRCGFLLSKSLGWRVLPIPEISVGASPSMPASSDADQLVSLEDFISYNATGSGIG